MEGTTRQQEKSMFIWAPDYCFKKGKGKGMILTNQAEEKLQVAVLCSSLPGSPPGLQN